MAEALTIETRECLPVDRSVGGVLRDERGCYSMARVSFAVTLSFTLVMIYRHATWAATCPANQTCPGLNPPDAAYHLLLTVLVAEILWAGGNRGLEYLAPALASIAQIGARIAMRFAERPPATRGQSDGAPPTRSAAGVTIEDERG